MLALGSLHPGVAGPLQRQTWPVRDLEAGRIGQPVWDLPLTCWGAVCGLRRLTRRII